MAAVRRVGGGYPTVLDALVVLLRSLAASRPTEADHVGPHLDAIVAEAEGAGLLDVDLRYVRDVVDRARAELAAGQRSSAPAHSDST